MTQSEHIDEHAAGIASLPFSDPERIAAEAHAATCARCASALRQSAQLMALIDEALLPVFEADGVQRAQADIWLRIRRQERRTAIATAASVLVSFGVALLLATHHAFDPHRWLVALSVLASALLFAVLAGHGRWLSMGLSLATSVLVASLVGSQSGVAMVHGLCCIGVELAAAVIPYATLAFGVLRAPEAGQAPYFAAASVAGALAGQAALVITCPEHSHTPHQFAAHVAGVVAAALISYQLRTRAVATLIREGQL